MEEWELQRLQRYDFWKKTLLYNARKELPETTMKDIINAIKLFPAIERSFAWEESILFQDMLIEENE